MLGVESDFVSGDKNLTANKNWGKKNVCPEGDMQLTLLW